MKAIHLEMIMNDDKTFTKILSVVHHNTKNNEITLTSVDINDNIYYQLKDDLYIDLQTTSKKAAATIIKLLVYLGDEYLDEKANK